MSALIDCPRPGLSPSDVERDARSRRRPTGHFALVVLLDADRELHLRADVVDAVDRDRPPGRRERHRLGRAGNDGAIEQRHRLALHLRDEQALVAGDGLRCASDRRRDWCRASGRGTRRS